jgi:hypothetical protein
MGITRLHIPIVPHEEIYFYARISQTSGPDHPSRMAIARKAPKSVTIGPLVPSLMACCDQALAGKPVAINTTDWRSSALLTTCAWVASRPRPDHTGTLAAARS